MSNVGKHSRVTLVRSAERFVTEGPGTSTWSLLSTGPHWAADRLPVGPVVGVDEHVLEPGAGFPTHAHRGVDVVTRVVEGQLHHSGTGDPAVLRSGEVAVLRAGSGAQHEERAGPDGARIVQTWLAVPPGPASYERAPAPAVYGDVPLDLAAGLRTGLVAGRVPLPPGVLLVLAGEVEAAGQVLAAGDALLVPEDHPTGWLDPGGPSADVLLWVLRPTGVQRAAAG